MYFQFMNTQRILSPCINNCKLDAKKDICIGCGRTSKEITNWIFYSDEKRLSIMNDLHGRLNDYSDGNTTKKS